MENLKAKLKKQGGFTMVEMLIVVAIIAILLAVSIPMFNNALERTRHGVDQANMRDAVSLATVQYLTDMNPTTNFAAGKTYAYVVDDSTSDGHDHQGHLEEIPAGGGTTAPKGVTPQCTCGSATAGLTVTVNLPGTGDDGRPKITLNWTTGTDGKTDSVP